jgi:hypothetical protein
MIGRHASAMDLGGGDAGERGDAPALPYGHATAQVPVNDHPVLSAPGQVWSWQTADRL